MSFFSELKRRNVFRVTAAYIVLSWLLMQVADLLMDMLGLPDIWGKAVFGLLLMGIVPAIIFSWVYEMTPEGLKRESEINRESSITVETGHKLNIAIIVLLIVAIGVYSVDNFMLAPNSRPAEPAAGQPAEVASTSQSLPVIAVLPLQALSAEDEGQFLAAGLHDDLLTRLARLKAFRVISRTSVMEYANTTKNIREIGSELGAGYILEGGLQAIGGNVRINAQLIDASSDEHLWAETYNRALTTANLFDVQGEIAGAIAGAMHAALSPQELEQINAAPTENFDAYAAFLRGRASSSILTRPAIEATVEAFAEAVELDPQFAEAWARLSESLSRKYWETGAEDGTGADPSVRAAALDALQQAQDLAPDAVMTLVAEAYYYYYGFRDYTRALDITGRAQVMAPNDTDVRYVQAFLSRRLGRMSEAADRLLAVLQVDPNSPSLIAQATGTLVDAHRCTEARRFSNSLQDRFPDDVDSDLAAAIVSGLCDHDFIAARKYASQMSVTTFQQMSYVVHFLYQAGDYDGAIDLVLEKRDTLGAQPTIRLWIENRLAELYRLTGKDKQAEVALQNAGELIETIDDPGATARLEFAYTAALRGDVIETRVLGQRLLETLPDDAYRYPDYALGVAAAYMLVGLTDEALTLLEETSAAYTFEQEMILEHMTSFEPLRADPRFKAIVESVEVY